MRYYARRLQIFLSHRAFFSFLCSHKKKAEKMRLGLAGTQGREIIKISSQVHTGGSQPANCLTKRRPLLSTWVLLLARAHTPAQQRGNVARVSRKLGLENNLCDASWNPNEHVRDVGKRKPRNARACSWRDENVNNSLSFIHKVLQYRNRRQQNPALFLLFLKNYRG